MADRPMPNFGRDGLMAIAAFRYCLGRRTYIVSDCEEWLIDQWPILPKNVRNVIARDLRDAVKSDNESRAEGGSHHDLGDDCDRAAWLRVLAMIDAMKVAEHG